MIPMLADTMVIMSRRLERSPVPPTRVVSDHAGTGRRASSCPVAWYVRMDGVGALAVLASLRGSPSNSRIRTS